MQKFEHIEKSLQGIIADGVPGNDMLIYKDGKEVFRSFRGYSDLENQILMNGKEKYNMYSCSKPITATATMQLIENKLITLDTPLYAVMPEFKDMYVKQGDKIVKANNHITVKHLLTMTAGFSYDLNYKGILAAREKTNGECPTVYTIKHLSEEVLQFEPGTKWDYSLCHDILAAVIEVVSNMQFGEYIKKNIFTPLGMNNSTFMLPQEQLDTVCAQYNNTEHGIKRVSNEIQYYKFGSKYESGGAGLVSTVDDYIKFLEALRIGNIILSENSINLMQTSALAGVDISGYWPQNNGYSYGLGVRCPKTPNDTEITDFGWGGAAGSYLGIDKNNGISLFYGMHVLNMGDLDGKKSFLKTLKKDLNQGSIV